MTARTALFKLTSTLRVLTLLFPGEEVQAAEEALQKALNMSKNRISLRRVRVWSSPVMQNGCKVGYARVGDPNVSVRGLVTARLLITFLCPGSHWVLKP